MIMLHYNNLQSNLTSKSFYDKTIVKYHRMITRCTKPLLRYFRFSNDQWDDHASWTTVHLIDPSTKQNTYVRQFTLGKMLREPKQSKNFGIKRRGWLLTTKNRKEIIQKFGLNKRISGFPGHTTHFPVCDLVSFLSAHTCN